MNPINRPRAEEIAKLPYTSLVIPSETTDGEPSFIAFTPELKGCMGQGSTPEEAIEDLALARIDYIHSLLDDNLPVPPPQIPTAVSESCGESFIFHHALSKPNLDAVLPSMYVVVSPQTPATIY